MTNVIMNEVCNIMKPIPPGCQGGVGIFLERVSGEYMRFWTDGGFFSSVKGHVFKWWRLIIMPILRINNNSKNQQSMQSIQSAASDEQTMTHNDSMQQFQEKQVNVHTAQVVTEQSELREQAELPNQDRKSSKEAMPNEDPMEVLRRINEEKEEQRRKEIEVARKQAQEQERINSIMNANKVDVNAYIEAGKAAKLEKENELKEKNHSQDDTTQRAQEILERLNREAAEDEAKKQAEIEAAKREAEKRFG